MFVKTTSKFSVLIGSTLLLATFLLSSFNSSAQYKPFANQYTPKGRLHMLFILVNDSNSPTTGWPNNFPNSSSLPNSWKDVANLNVSTNNEENPIINFAQNTVSTNQNYHNISEFFRTFSNPNSPFIVTGYVYPTVISVAGASTYAQHKSALDWIQTNDPNFNWSSFDIRAKHTSTTRYQSDNSNTGPDGNIDYVVFIHNRTGNAERGLASVSVNQTVSTSPNLKVNTGFTIWGSPDNVFDILPVWVHELAHTNMSAPHYSGANNTHGYKYFVNNFYGLMGGGGWGFYTPTAWESWTRGWLGNLQEITEFTINSTGEYTLKDFATTNSAIRIKIPFSDRAAMNNEFQYLWLENHQKITFWDEKKLFTAQMMTRMSKGIYAYITDNSGAELNQLYQRANFIKPLSAAGSWDWVDQGITTPSAYGHTIPVFEYGDENPLMGCTFRTHLPYERDGNSNELKLGQWSGNSNQPPYDKVAINAVRVNGIIEDEWQPFGGDKEAFKLGDKLGISGIMPIVNYPDYFDKAGVNSNASFARQTFEPFYMNGLSVEVIGVNGNDIKIRVKYDDTEIKRDMRWTGHVVIPNLVNTPAGGILVTNSKTLKLNRTKTPSRQTPHITTGDYFTPSILDIEYKGKLIVDGNSELIIDERSVVNIQSGGAIVVKNNGVVYVRGKSSLVIHDGGAIIVEGNGKVIIEYQGALTYLKGAVIQLTDASSLLEVQGGLNIGDNANFTFNGTGFVRFGLSNAPNNGPNVNCGINSSISLAGTGYSDKLVEIMPNTYVYPNANCVLFELSKGGILMGEDAYLHSSIAEFNWRDLWITAMNPNQRHLGFIANGQMNHQIENNIISGGHYGIRALQFNTDNAVLNMSKSTITDCGIGLWATAAGCVLKEVSLDGCGIGYKHDVPTKPSVVSRSSFNGNSSRGIEYSSAGGDLLIDECDVRFNGSDGVYFRGTATIEVSCGQITRNNQSNVNGNGILLGYNSTLDMDNGARVDITENYGAIRLALAKEIKLNEGRNHLLTNPKNQGRSVYGTLLQFPTSNITIPCNRNRWNDRGTSTLGKIPSLGADYSINTLNSFIAHLTDPIRTLPNDQCAVSIDGNGHNYNGGSGKGGNGGNKTGGDKKETKTSKSSELKSTSMESIQKANDLINNALAENQKGNLDGAITILNEAEKLASSEQAKIITYYRCQFDKIAGFTEGDEHYFYKASLIVTCEDKANKYILSMKDGSKVSTKTNQFEFAIYPNPNFGKLHIQWDKNDKYRNEEVQIKILDLTGREIQKVTEINSNSALTDFNQYSGVYVVEFKCGNYITSKRFVLINN